MSKIRVHELAKKLNLNSKDVVDKLTSLGIEVKNHMSSITADDAIKVSSAMTKSDTSKKNTQIDKSNIKPNVKSYNQMEGTSMNTQSTDNLGFKSKEESEVKSTQQAEAPKNTEQQNSRPQGDRPSYNPNRPQGDRPPYNPNRPQGDRPPYNPNRPQGDRPPYNPNRPQGDRPPYNPNRPQGDRPPYNPNRPQGDRPPYNPNRPQGDRPPYNPNRPQGDRPPYNPNRPQGDRPPYNPNRPQGDRPPYNPNRPQGDRPPYNPNRPQGDRPPYNPNRPQGDRPPYNPNRPQGQGGYNNRPQGQGGYNNRPQGQGGYNNRPQGQGGYNNRPQGQGGYRGGNTIDDKLRAFEKSKEKISTPTITEKPDKDHVRRLAKAPVKTDRNTIPKNSERPMERAPFKKFVKIKKEPKKINMEPRIIQIPELLTVKQLAEVMGVAGSDVIKILVKKGEMITLNQEVDFEAATSIAENFNVMVEAEIEIDLFEENFSEEPENETDLIERPPVVVVMGHVDHGKTSLLDSIKNSAVTSGEAGGITQHIGAYTVQVKGKPITFLDTPGHEAFTAMRMRGAQITDIAILVVAADDGVMPQTIEAINHAKAAGVDVIVAINKIDRPSANPERVKQELTEHGLIAEEWGGETICVPVSAINKTGISQLLEMILLTSEIKELKANPNKRARGTIIDARLDKGRGTVATVLVQSGTLNIGDPIVAGGVYGKVRAMMDDKGARVKKAGPSKPVEILGLTETPEAGDMFYVAESDKHARQVAEAYVAKGRVEMTKSQTQKVSLDDLFNQIQEGKLKDLNIIVKADVQGSAEAVRQSLEKLSNEEVRVKIIHSGVGTVNESDVMLASASGAIIIGFNVRPEVAAKTMADEQDVDIRLYRVIYSAIEDVQAAMKGMLDPIFEEKIIGHAEIRQIFKASNVGTIGGGYITDGKFIRSAKTRVTREGKLIFEGPLDTLKRFKDDVKEVAAGYECGFLFSKFNDIKEGDLVEAYIMEEVER